MYAVCREAFKHTHTRSINHTTHQFHPYSRIKLKNFCCQRQNRRACLQARTRLLPFPLPASPFRRLCDPLLALLTADETFGVTCLFRFDFPLPQHLSSCLSIHASQTHHSRAQICESHRLDDNNLCKLRIQGLSRFSFFFLFFYKLIVLINTSDQGSCIYGVG